MKIRKQNKIVLRLWCSGYASLRRDTMSEQYRSLVRASTSHALTFTPCRRLNVDIIVYASTVIKTFYQSEITFNNKFKLFIFVTYPHICPSVIKHPNCLWMKFQIDIWLYDNSKIEIIF